MDNTDFIFCPNCGAKLPFTSKFCNKCGAKIPTLVSPIESSGSSSYKSSSPGREEDNLKSNDKSGLSENVQTTLGCVIMIVIAVFAFSFFPKSCSSASYNREGYEYLCNNLKSPSSAKLLAYIDKKMFRDYMKEKAHLTYSSDFDWEVYDVEAKNGFGGATREKYAILFYKGKPLCVDELILSIMTTEHDDLEDDYFLKDYIRMNKDVYGITIDFSH